MASRPYWGVQALPFISLRRTLPDLRPDGLALLRRQGLDDAAQGLAIRNSFGGLWKRHTCVYIYIHIYIHIYMYMYTHICVYIYTHACMHACMHTYIHTYIHRYVRTYTYIVFLLSFLYVCMYVCMHVFVHGPRIMKSGGCKPWAASLSLKSGVPATRTAYRVCHSSNLGNGPASRKRLWRDPGRSCESQIIRQGLGRGRMIIGFVLRAQISTIQGQRETVQRLLWFLIGTPGGPGSGVFQVASLHQQTYSSVHTKTLPRRIHM